MGEPLTDTIDIDARDGFRLWAPHYDEAPNALLALEMRLLSGRIRVTPGTRLLDAGSGTGRWMSWARARGAEVFGIDSCREMVLKAEEKAGLRGRSAVADVGSIPLADDSVDLALCSFTMGYVASPALALRELARVSPEVVVSDLHPDAVRAGWTRSFRAGDLRYELGHFSFSAKHLDGCAREAGLTLVWRIRAVFGEPERAIFAQAGKQDWFDKARSVPAVSIALWRRRSD